MSINEMMLREQIAKEIESIPIADGGSQLNALGMRLIAAKVARGKDNHTNSMFEKQMDFE